MFFFISVLQSAHALDTAYLTMNVGKRTTMIILRSSPSSDRPFFIKAYNQFNQHGASLIKSALNLHLLAKICDTCLKGGQKFLFFFSCIKVYQI